MATIPRTVPPEASSQSVMDAKRQIFRKLFLLQFLRLAFLGTTLFLFLFGFAVLISRFLRSELAITVLSWTWMLEFLLLAGVGWIAWNRKPGSGGWGHRYTCPEPNAKKGVCLVGNKDTSQEKSFHCGTGEPPSRQHLYGEPEGGCRQKRPESHHG